MRILNDYLNAQSVNSLAMLSRMQPYLDETLLKSIDVFACFGNKSMHHSEKFSMEFHPVPNGEFKKLKSCYAKAMWMAQQKGVTSLTDLVIEIVYVDHKEKETKVLLSPAGALIDLSHLTLSDEEI